MTSITTFAYGLTVRTNGLIVGAQAWPSIEPTSHFFDLLFLRKRLGTLRFRSFESGQDCVGSVPVEVWERIRRWVVVVEMEDAEERMGEDVLGIDDCNSVDCRWRSSGHRVGARFLDAVEMCESCDESAWDWTVDLCEGNHAYHESTQKLVATFGLALPLDQFIRTSPEIYSDRECVALIAIPSQLHCNSKTSTTISASAGRYVGTDEQTIVDVDLTLPADADLRFARFLRLFNLEVVDTSICTLKSVKPDVAAKAQIKRLTNPARHKFLLQEEFSGVVDLPARGIQPKWKLYTTSMMVS